MAWRVWNVAWEGMECGMGGYGMWHGRVWSVAWEGMECGMGGYGIWVYREVVHEAGGYTNLENSIGGRVGSGRIGSGRVG